MSRASRLKGASRRAAGSERSGRLLLVLLLLVVVPWGVRAQAPSKPGTGKLSLMTLVPELTPISDYRGDFWNRSTLFGDVGGFRQDLYEKGVALDFMLTQVPQGVVSGGEDTVWKYGASADYYLFLDSGRLGLWPGGLLGVHAETKFGRSVLPSSGVISPVNADYLWPTSGEKDETFLSEYYLYQGLAKNPSSGSMSRRRTTTGSST